MPLLMGNSLNAWSDALAGFSPAGLPVGLLIIAAIPLVFIALYALTYGVYGERKIPLSCRTAWDPWRWANGVFYRHWPTS